MATTASFPCLVLGEHGELHFALLDVKNSIRRFTLRKESLIFFIGGYRPSPVRMGEQGFGK
jgi:hypothetical protein